MVRHYTRARKKNKAKAQEIIDKISEVVKAEKSEIPSVIALSKPYSYDIWVLWRATDRRFLPSQLMQEDESLLSDMLLLDSAYEAIKDRYNGNKNN